MERRRIGKVVHDERGNARLEWADAPAESEKDRTLLSLEQTQPVRRADGGYNPYASSARDPRKPPQPAPDSPGGKAPRRDLHKLSEWIKQMRRLEELKRESGED